MADENKTDDTTGAGEPTTPAEIVAPKMRGPRPKKVVSDATAETAGAVPGVKRGRKRKEKPADVKAATQPQAAVTTRAKGVAKTAGRGRAPKLPAETSVPVLDEIADLVRLEEENARLRKALGEKLRAENADLRKRLGLA